MPVPRHSAGVAGASCAGLGAHYFGPFLIRSSVRHVIRRLLSVLCGSRAVSRRGGISPSADGGVIRTHCGRLVLALSMLRDGCAGRLGRPDDGFNKDEKMNLRGYNAKFRQAERVSFLWMMTFLMVMAGLVPAVHVLSCCKAAKTSMPGLSSRRRIIDLDDLHDSARRGEGCDQARAGRCSNAAHAERAGNAFHRHCGDWRAQSLQRHGRTCSGHPRLDCREAATWMPREAGMTEGGVSAPLRELEEGAQGMTDW